MTNWLAYANIRMIAIYDHLEVKHLPKDKTANHIKINEAMKAEFLEKGFSDASIRSIGQRAGLTSAALYRHYRSKEEMFCAVVEPLVQEIQQRMMQHKQVKYRMLDEKVDSKMLFGESVIDIVKEVIIPHRTEFYLLVKCANGTRYENFVHDFVEANQGDLADAIDCMKAQGYPAIHLEKEELHMLLSAYMTAIIEPIIHGYPDEQITAYLDRMSDFFMPGWMSIMGLSPKESQM